MSNTKRPDPAVDPTAIGHVAKIFGGVADDKLAEALELQRSRPGMRLGEALLVVGALAPHELKRLMGTQARLRDSPKSDDIKKIMEYAMARSHAASRRVRELCRSLDPNEDEE